MHVAKEEGSTGDIDRNDLTNRQVSLGVDGTVLQSTDDTALEAQPRASEIKDIPQTELQPEVAGVEQELSASRAAHEDSIPSLGIQLDSFAVAPTIDELDEQRLAFVEDVVPDSDEDMPIALSLADSIPGLYQILDLVAEHGSGGLSESSLCWHMNIF